jgi:hypothetical protein
VISHEKGYPLLSEKEAAGVYFFGVKAANGYTNQPVCAILKTKTSCKHLKG